MTKLKTAHPFYIALALILLAALLFRLVPIWNNFFYFTIDQGRDAVFIRDILNGNLHLMGPITAITGLFTGPLWYYLLAIGFFLTGGHPIGGILVLVAINLATATGLALFLKPKLGPALTLLVTSALLFSQGFIETSLYAFNPHLAASLAIITALSLISITKKNQNLFLLAGLATGLTFHSEIAFAIPLTVTFLLWGIFLTAKKHLTLEFLGLGLVTFTLTLTPHLISELTTNFSQAKAALSFIQNPTVISSAPITPPQQLLETLGQTIFYPHATLGLVALAILVLLTILLNPGINNPGIVNIKNKLKTNQNPLHNQLTAKFSFFTLSLWLISLVWFSLIAGLEPWHLAALPPLTILTLALALTSLPNKFALSSLAALIALQLTGTTHRLTDFRNNPDDQSLLKNQLAAIDWVYNQADNQGFKAFTYVPSVHDFPYQYLFYWHGLGTYDYLPCKYAADAAGATSYVPHAKLYTQPSKPCTDQIYLILQPPVHQHLQDQWQAYVAPNTELIDSTQIGRITLQKLHQTTN